MKSRKLILERLYGKQAIQPWLYDFFEELERWKEEYDQNIAQAKDILLSLRGARDVLIYSTLLFRCSKG